MTEVTICKKLCLSAAIKFVHVMIKFVVKLLPLLMRFSQENFHSNNNGLNIFTRIENLYSVQNEFSNNKCRSLKKRTIFLYCVILNYIQISRFSILALPLCKRIKTKTDKWMKTGTNGVCMWLDHAVFWCSLSWEDRCVRNSILRCWSCWLEWNALSEMIVQQRRMCVQVQDEERFLKASRKPLF